MFSEVRLQSCVSELRLELDPRPIATMQSITAQPPHAAADGSDDDAPPRALPDPGLLFLPEPSACAVITGVRFSCVREGLVAGPAHRSLRCHLGRHRPAHVRLVDDGSDLWTVQLWATSATPPESTVVL